MNAPTPKAIRDARLSAGLSQSDAARMVYVTLRCWQRWEASGKEGRPIPGAAWELFLLKAKPRNGSRTPEQQDEYDRMLCRVGAAMDRDAMGLD